MGDDDDRRKIIFIILAIIVIAIVVVILTRSTTAKTTGSCSTDADCPNGKCQDGSCVECITNDDCTGTNVCQDSVCVSGSCDPYCTLNLSNQTYDDYSGAKFFEMYFQPDGKMILGTNTGAGTIAIRVNTDGTIDTTWATAGVLTPPECCGGAQAVMYGHVVGADNTSYSIGVFTDQPNWSIGEDWFVAIMKFLENGTLDTSYGVNGFAVYDTDVISATSAYGYPRFNAPILLSDGSVIAYSQYKVYKITPAGVVDPVWNGGSPVDLVGIDTTTTYELLIENSFSYYTRIYRNPKNGKIYYWSIFTGPDGTRGGHLVLNSDGTLDTTYGDGGFVLIDYDLFLGNTIDPCDSIPIYSYHSFLADGSFLVSSYAAGDVFTASTTCDEYYTWVVKYKLNGQVDTSFGTNGLVSYGSPVIESDVEIASAIIENTCDGSLLMPTANYISGLNYIVKFDKNGTFIGTFAQQQDEYICSAGVSPSGKIVIAASISPNPTTRIRSYDCPFLAH
jgi:uncharacterized delta-60 repeat protein